MKSGANSVLKLVGIHATAGALALASGCARQNASFSGGPVSTQAVSVSDTAGRALGSYPGASPSPSNAVTGSYPDPTPSPSQVSGAYPSPTSGAGGYPTPKPSPSSSSGFGGYPVPIPSFGSGSGGYPIPTPSFGSGVGGYPNPAPSSTPGAGAYPTPSPSASAGAGNYPTSIPVNPTAVCGPSITTGQAMITNTTNLVAVLYKSSNFAMNSGATVVQAWDASSDTAQLHTQLAALKPFQIALNEPLAPGTYSLVFYNASQAKAPYSYDWTNSANAVAPIADSIAKFLDSSAVMTVSSSGKITLPQSYNVLVALQGSSDCNGAGTIDPLTINLGNSPIQLSPQSQGVSMDLDGNGTINQISWFLQPAQAALLVNATGGIPANGAIGPAQIFGNFTEGPDGQVAANGYDALAKFDENGDGVIDSKDPIFANLRLWEDLNRDGVAQPSELIPLSQAGIVSLELPHTSANHIVRESCHYDPYGNQFCQGKGAFVTISSGGKTVRKELVDIGFKPLN